MEWLGIIEFARSYRHWFAVAFIVSTIVFSVDRTVALAGAYLERWRTKRRCIKRLNSLTNSEKPIVRHYLERKTRANHLRAGDGTVAGLVSCGIIYQAATIDDPAGVFAFNITEDAWHYLQKHHERILLPKSHECRDDRFDAMHKNDHRYRTDDEERLENVKVRINNIARDVQTDKDVPWQEQSCGLLRAVVKKEFFDDYEAILKKDNPRREAGIFLRNLAENLVMSHLR